MTDHALLNNVDHHDLRVITRHGAEYGDDINQVLVFPTEFESIQREYPIVFRRDQEGVFRSVALLGLDRDENLFLDAEGWQARYVPAIQQRGPFSIALQETLVDGAPQREPMIRIDMAHARVSRTEGVPLFLPQGGNSPYLERVAALLRVIYSGHNLMAPMFTAFGAAGLIQPVSLDVQLNEAQSYTIAEIFTIDEKRLAELDGAALEALHRAGFLRAAFHVAASLGNIQRLIELKNRKQAAGGA